MKRKGVYTTRFWLYDLLLPIFLLIQIKYDRFCHPNVWTILRGFQRANGLPAAKVWIKIHHYMYHTRAYVRGWQGVAVFLEFLVLFYFHSSLEVITKCSNIIDKWYYVAYFSETHRTPSSSYCSRVMHFEENSVLWLSTLPPCHAYEIGL